MIKVTSPKPKRVCRKIKARVSPGVDDKSLSQLAAALGHPARVAIIRLLKERDVCLCGEIVEVLPLAQSTVSQHLKVLKQAGWIQGEVDAQRVCYCLDLETLTRFEALVGTL